ncbi:MAG: deoxyribose-phosphate aldolase [Actinomycetota bacterium]|jgi:deoxyribose-phosphate aldolase
MPVASDARRVLALVDLTDLGEAPTAEAITQLCRRATGSHGSTAAVCVWPRFVAQAKALLASSGVRVATVVNFPDGGSDADLVVAETRAALAAGADEIDLVMPYRAFLAGHDDVVVTVLDRVRACVVGPARLKVILETGAHPDRDSIARATVLAIDHGADFVKTSTGKTSVSATPDAVRTMLEVIRGSGRAVGIKPSGGIRTLDDARAYLAIADDVMGASWATPETFRFGASGLLDALESAIEGAGDGFDPGAVGDGY